MRPVPDGISLELILLVGVTSLFIFFATLVPLTGTLVRFRANYNPKGLRIAEEDEAEQGVSQTPVVGPIIRSYFGMFARVYRLEGFSGLFKGLMPSLIFRVIFILTPMVSLGSYNILVDIRLDMIILVLYAILFSLPATVIMYRAMTTTEKLSPFKPRDALRVLLSPYERSHCFLRVYSAPGLFVTWAAYIILSAGVFFSIRKEAFLDITAVLGNIIRRRPIEKDNIVGWIRIFVGLGASALLLTPLEVVLVRLSIQRKNGSAGNADLATEETSLLETQAGTVVNEDVITLHPDSDPYTGLVDCVRRIVKEEGWSTLYRGWWITLIFGGFHSSFV